MKLIQIEDVVFNPEGIDLVLSHNPNECVVHFRSGQTPVFKMSPHKFAEAVWKAQNNQK